MVTTSRIEEIIGKTIENLQSSGVIEGDFSPDRDTVILGKGSPIDSIAFVTLISDLEQLLEDETGAEFFINMADIHDLNEGKTASLSVADMADGVARLME